MSEDFHIVFQTDSTNASPPNIVEITDYEAELIKSKNERKEQLASTLTTKLANYLNSIDKSNSVENYIAGLVYGCAIGDCLGAQYKGRSSAGLKINKLEYSTYGFRGMDPYTWSDDTDQLVIAMNVFLSNDMQFTMKDFSESLLEWKKTGFSSFDNKKPHCSYLLNAVLSDPKYLNAPFSAAKAFHKKVGSIAPNCCLTRSSLFGLFPNWKTLVVNQCMLTHADPRCIYACYQIAKITRAVLRRQFDISVDELFSDYAEFIPSSWKTEMQNYIKKYNIPDVLSQLELDHDTITEQQYVLRSLGCVVYAYKTLAHNREINVVLHEVLQAGGDTDTNCAVVGLILGAAYGYMNIDASLILKLTNHKWLDTRIVDFLNML